MCPSVTQTLLSHFYVKPFQKIFVGQRESPGQQLYRPHEDRDMFLSVSEKPRKECGALNLSSHSGNTHTRV